MMMMITQCLPVISLYLSAYHNTIDNTFGGGKAGSLEKKSLKSYKFVVQLLLLHCRSINCRYFITVDIIIVLCLVAGMWIHGMNYDHQRLILC